MIKIKNITKRQKEVLKTIYDYIKSSGFPPTFGELKEDIGVSSNQSLLDLFHNLEQKGFIKREEGAARAIKILKRGFEILNVRPLIPIVGTTAAGSFLESIEEIGSWEILSQEVSKLSDELMIVKVNGDSMKNAGINDGDLVLIKKTSNFKLGDIVLIQCPDGTTLKRIIFEGGKYYLKPENPQYQKIEFSEDTEIIGVKV